MSFLRAGICSTLTLHVIEKLKDANIKTILDFITTDLEQICQKSGVPYKDLVVIRRILLAQFSAFPVNGFDLFESAVSSSTILSSGVKSLDRLLDGGLYTSEVTEVAGETAAGKTQLCLTLAAVVSCEAKQSVLYIDTCGAFSAERLAEISESRYGTQTAEKMLQNVRCVHAFDIYSVIAILENVKAEIVKKMDSFYGNLKMVIVDNVASVIYPILGGQQMDGHSLMVHLSMKLKQLASDYSLAVVVSNNVVRVEGSTVAGLGRTWSHIPHTRLIISPCDDQPSSMRSLTMVKCSRAAPHESMKIVIADKGVLDPG